MKIRGSSVLILLLVGACSSSSGGALGGTSGAGGQAGAGSEGKAGNGVVSNADAGSGGAAGNSDAGSGGAAGEGDAGNGAAAGNVDVGSGGAAGNVDAGNGAAGAAGSGEVCPQGTWKAVQYSCGTDAPAAIPAVAAFTFGINETAGMFSQANTIGSFSCTNSNNGHVTCDGPTMDFDTGTTLCSPENCLSKSECGAPGPYVVFTFSQPTPTTLVTVTPETTELTTCTGAGKSNPVTFYWQRQ